MESTAPRSVVSALGIPSFGFSPLGRHGRGFVSTMLLAAPFLTARAAPPAERPAYDALVERARAGDRELDLGKLREAAAKAGVETELDAKEELWKAVKKGDWREVQRAADLVLSQNYVDLDAHYLARRAARQLGDAAGEDLHHWLEIGLLQELRKTGDGRSEMTPMVVLSVDEEYFIFRMLEVSVRSQTVVKCGKSACDLMRVVDEGGKESTWYFDIHIPMERLARNLAH